MAGRIPESFIDDLLARVDIVELVQQRIALKRTGREYQSTCPFHDEKTPSFTVSPGKQFYHCFGCGAHGNAIGYLMEYDRLGFVDAIEELARLAGIEIPREMSTRPDGSNELYAILAQAEQFFQRQLRANNVAVDYLKNRGITGEVASRFGMGFAPDSWDSLLKELGTNPAAIGHLEQSGMLSTRDSGGHYDKFRNRIMFPIHDTRGRPIAFGGRVMENDSGPKYLNSPETPLFHKGRQLYGLFQARQAVPKPERLVVVEGYMDVIALVQYGYPEVVAALGTATSADHAETLFRATPEVVFCFDGDRAGRQAAERALDSVLPRLRDGRQARFLFLPDGEDPDSLVRRQGLDAFRDGLEHSTALSDFFFAQYQAQVDMNSLDGRSRLIELCRPRLEQIPNGAFREMMFERMSELAKTRVSFAAAPGQNRPPTPSSQPARRTLVRSAISLLLQRPGLAQRVIDTTALENLKLPGIDLLLEAIDICQKRPNLNTGSLLEHWRGQPQERHLAKLVGSSLLADNHDLDKEFDDSIEALRRQSNRQRCDELQLKQAESGLSEPEKQDLRRLLTQRAGGQDPGDNH